MNAALLHSLMSLTLITTVIGSPEINDHVKSLTAFYVKVIITMNRIGAVTCCAHTLSNGCVRVCVLTLSATDRNTFAQECSAFISLILSVSVFSHSLKFFLS